MICPTCSKVYQRNTKAFLEHCRKCGAESHPLKFDSPAALAEILKVCVDRITTLEAEVASLKRSGPVRTEPLEWLNENVRCTCSYLHTLEKARIDIEWLDTEKNLCGCAAGWIIETLQTTEAIRAFRSLPGVLYTYRDEAWQQLDQTQAESLLDYVARRFLKAFQEWGEENQGLVQSDKKNAVYFQRLQKITGAAGDRIDTAHRLTSALHRRLRRRNPPGVTFTAAS